MTRQSLDQERAAFAWGRVAQAKNQPTVDFDAFTNLAKSAPALIMSNGLMPTLAFIEQKFDEKKGKNLHARELNKAICDWLGKKVTVLMGPNFVQVMEGLHAAPSTDYIFATEEALEILRWIRQFAPALGKD